MLHDCSPKSVKRMKLGADFITNAPFFRQPETAFFAQRAQTQNAQLE
ncbi:hypothetical protein [Alysiella filiformis]|nr:hypothetical protein [Alysiella filiformis]UBQ56626.1 hypothetical protein JF568_02285 [Alysiella filiformis DSM 16848]